MCQNVSGWMDGLMHILNEWLYNIHRNTHWFKSRLCDFVQSYKIKAHYIIVYGQLHNFTSELKILGNIVPLSSIIFSY